MKNNFKLVLLFALGFLMIFLMQVLYAQSIETSKDSASDTITAKDCIDVIGQKLCGSRAKSHCNIFPNSSECFYFDRSGTTPSSGPTPNPETTPSTSY